MIRHCLLVKIKSDVSQQNSVGKIQKTCKKVADTFNVITDFNSSKLLYGG